MKKLFFIPLIVFSFSCQKEKRYQYYDSGNINEECEYQGDFRNRECTHYYENGEIRSKYSYENDTLNGWSYFYHLNGKLNWKVYFEKGLKNGQIDYFDENGNIFQTSTFKNNVLNGISKTYYENGNVRESMNYNNGILDGDAQVYSNDGNVKIQIKYELGDIVDFFTYDTLNQITSHLIKFSFSEIKFGEDYYYSVKVKNKIFDVALLTLFKKEKSNLKYLVENEYIGDSLMLPLFNKHGIELQDTVFGYIIELDTLDSERGVIKSKRHFYLIGDSIHSKITPNDIIIP